MLRTLTCACVLLGGTPALAGGVELLRDFNAATALAQRNQMPVMLEFSLGAG